MRWLLVISLLVACGDDSSTDGGLDADMLDSGALDTGTDAESDAGVDALAIDAPMMACDAVEETEATVMTSTGSRTVRTTGFEAGDCITFSGASIALIDAVDGTVARISLSSFPVMVNGDDERFVEGGSFMTTVTLNGLGESEPLDAMVDVTTWQEHPGDAMGHEIDIAVSIEGFDAPIVVRGRFCEWANLLC